MAKSMGKGGLARSLGDMGWPLVIGIGLSALFYIAVYIGPLNSPVMHRYFSTHPIAFAATVMFWIGVAALAVKMADLIGQYAALDRVVLEEPPHHGQAIEECAGILDSLDELPPRTQHSYLARRFRDALEFVERKGAAEGIDEHLKHLADRDADRQHDSFALVRILIWATPMLGFLGTVVGITQALGDLDAGEMTNSFESAMNGLLAGLYIAFDTTALALTLSIILMFAQFVVDRAETKLLFTVDARVEDELSGRFVEYAGRDGQMAAIQRMSDKVVRSSEKLVQRQSELWQNTIDAAHQHWSRLSGQTAEQLQAGLSGALDQSLQRCAAALASIETQAAEKAHASWVQWQEALEKNAVLLTNQQQEMSRQTAVMTQAIDATADVVKLETALNENLSVLAGVGHFEQTVLSLSAAIQLLSSRLGPTDHRRPVELKRSDAEPAERTPASPVKSPSPTTRKKPGRAA